MTRLRVAPIVEGHGEVNAVRILLERVWIEVVGGEYVQVARPIRFPRTKLVKPDAADLKRAVEFAVLKLRGGSDPSLVLVLLDAHDDAACELGPRILKDASRSRPEIDLACVLANPDYETWFVAAANSLRERLRLPETVEIPEQPEQLKSGKMWIKRNSPRPYSETVDQPALTRLMDLDECRKRSASFDKLCRELDRCALCHSR